MDPFEEERVGYAASGSGHSCYLGVRERERDNYHKSNATHHNKHCIVSVQDSLYTVITVECFNPITAQYGILQYFKNFMKGGG